MRLLALILTLSSLLCISQINAVGHEDINSFLTHFLENSVLPGDEVNTISGILVNIFRPYQSRLDDAMVANDVALKRLVRRKPFSDEEKQILIAILDDISLSYMERQRRFKNVYLNTLFASEGIVQPEYQEPITDEPLPIIEEGQAIRYTRRGRDYKLKALPSDTPPTDSCMICLAEPEECSDTYRSICEHFACKECWRKYAESISDSGYPLKCPICRENLELRST